MRILMGALAEFDNRRDLGWLALDSDICVDFERWVEINSAEENGNSLSNPRKQPCARVCDWRDQSISERLKDQYFMSREKKDCTQYWREWPCIVIITRDKGFNVYYNINGKPLKDCKQEREY